VQTAMTEDPQQTAVENALLRGSLFLTASALKDYATAKHTKIDDTPMVQVTVHETLRNRATDALERAEKMLRDQR
jgi:hypothetical protein